MIYDVHVVFYVIEGEGSDSANKGLGSNGELALVCRQQFIPML